MRSRARLSRWPDIAHAALIEHSWLELTLRLAEGREQPPAIFLSPNSDPGPLGRIGSC